MCFSATASIIAGGGLSVIGVLTLRQVRQKRDLLFASIPLLFGIQQIVEGVVWLSFGTHTLNMVATYAYSMFSHVLWPILVPLSVLLIETDPIRKKVLRIFALVGLLVGLYLLHLIVADKVTAQIVGNSIAYHSPHLYPLTIMTLYLVATCGSCLCASNKIINIFGIALLASFGVSVWFFSETFFSVWCFFSAILSLLVLLFFRRNFTSQARVETS